jgi:mono/diheme cytochrome c family protein
MKFRLIALIVLLSVGLAACSFSLAEDITPPPNYVPPTPAPTLGPLYPSLPPSPLRGQAIFAEKCAACHGANGLGNGPQAAGLPVPVAAIGLADIARQSSPAEWFALVSQGRIDRYMPSFTSLSNQGRWDVLAYVYTLSAAPAGVAQGASVYADKCAACHGLQGKGDGPQAADLSSAPTNFTDQSLMSQATGIGLYRAISEGVPPDMPAYSSQLTESDRWALVDYLRSLTFDMSAPTATPLSSSTPAVAMPIPTLAAAETTPGATTPEAGATGEASATPLAAAETIATGEASATPEVAVGTITGTVVNGTGGALPEPLTVTLHGFTNMQETSSIDTVAAPDGSFTFADVPMESGMAYIVVVHYSDATYSSDIAYTDGATFTYDLPVTIYDTTTDTAALSVDRMHVFFDFSNAGVVQVVEIFVISNNSDKAIVPAGSGQPVARFVLPAGYTNLQFQSGALGDRYVQTDDGFGDTIGIVPGVSVYQMLFAFDLPYDKKLELTQPVNYPVASAVVMVPEGVKVSGDGLTDGGVQDMQGTSIHLYSIENIAAGNSLTVTVSGSQKSSTGGFSLSSQTSLVIGLGGLGIVLILAGLYLFFRDRARRAEFEEGDELKEGEEEEMEDALGDDPDSLTDAIIALDDQFKAGGIAKEAYENRRAALKERLKSLIAE